MNSTSQWIVLPPSREAAPLRMALLAHLKDRGIKALNGDLPNSDATQAQIIVTSDVEAAILAGAAEANITMVRLPGFIDLEGYGEASGASSEIYAASRKLAAARDFKGRSVKDLREIDMVGPDFRSDDVIRHAGDRPETPRETALRSAVAIYEAGSADWTSQLFVYDARNADRAPDSGEIDVTGRSRFLFSGPYIFLPTGKWRAALRLGFDDGAARASYHVDWGGGQNHVAHEFRPERSGVYEIVLNREWDGPGPSELRLALLEGVFHGRIVFHGAHIRNLR